MKILYFIPAGDFKNVSHNLQNIFEFSVIHRLLGRAYNKRFFLHAIPVRIVVSWFCLSLSSVGSLKILLRLGIVNVN